MIAGMFPGSTMGLKLPASKSPIGSRRLVVSLAALTAIFFELTSLPAKAASYRDIIYLNDYGGGISEISWCNDESFIFVKNSTSSSESNTFPPEYSKQATVNIFSTDARSVRPLLFYQNSGISANCVRNGEYVYINGRVTVSLSKDVKGAAQIPFAHLIKIAGEEISATKALWLSREGGASVLYSALTAADGSVYGQTNSGAGLSLGNITKSGQAAFFKKNLTYSKTQGDVAVNVFATTPTTSSPRAFPIYGIIAPEIRNIGTYRCQVAHPGCNATASSQDVIYYVYSKYNTSNSRIDAIFAITPSGMSLQQRWPVVGASGVRRDALEVVSVAMDETKCLVLLQPKPWLKSNRMNGRLSLDLYVSSCGFTGSQLEFGEPQRIAQKQASFIVPKLTLHGEFAVVTETVDLSAQEEDQVEIERASDKRRNVCARFYRPDVSGRVAHVNTVCAPLIRAVDADAYVSPNAKYVRLEGDGAPIIVGRDYRNDGAGPAWLNNGDLR